jgi:uncharacterized phage protein (TIGR02218 family)
LKTISAGLAAIMAGNNFLLAELYTFVLAGGTVLRYGDYDPGLPVLVAGGNSFPASGLKFKRTRTRQTIGLQVGSIDVEIFADPSDTTSYVNGVPLQQFVDGGGLDGATVQVDRCFMSVWGDCATNGTLLWFYGRASDVTFGRTSVKLTVKDLRELLNINMPRDVYQPGCLNTLFDANCTLSKSAFINAGAAQSGSTASVINIGAGGPPDGYFALGTITFTSGANSGISRRIKAHAGGLLALSMAFPASPAVNDTFNAYPGCDLAKATCQNKFANLNNFRGQLFVPVPETAR